ncbi:MAG: hypothetical protein ABL908_14245, partial [Hyphomicrobium sp.]
DVYKRQTPDGARLLTGSLDNTARVWNLVPGPDLGKELAVLKGHTSMVTSVAVTPDGARLITGSWDNTMRVWDLRPGPDLGKELAVLRGHTEMVSTVAVAPNGARLITGSADHTVRVWDLTPGPGLGRELAVLKGHTGSVSSVAVTPDGARLVTGSLDQTVRAWDLASGKQLAVIKGQFWITNVAVTPDGARLVTISIGNPQVWDLGSGKELAVLTGHEGAVVSVAVTPDGTRVVTGSHDNTVRVWNLASGPDLGKELAVLRGHTRPVTTVAVTPDGARLITGSADNTVRVWPLLPSGQQLIADLQAAVPRCLTPAERQLYHLAPSPPRWCGNNQKWPYDAVGAVTESAAIIRSGVADLSEAEILRAELLRVNPKATMAIDAAWAKAHVDRGTTLLRGGKDAESEAQFKLAQERGADQEAIDAGRSVAHLQRGKNLLGEGKDTEAEAQFKLAQERAGNPKAVEVARLEGYIARGENVVSDSNDKAKALAEATRVLDIAVELAGRDGVSRELKANAYFVRGRAHEESGRYEAAIIDFEHATELGHVWGKARIFEATNSQSSKKQDNGAFIPALLIGGSNFLSLDPSVRKSLDDDRIMNSLNRISYPLGALHAAPRLDATIDATDCDRLAAHPFEPLRTSTGIAFAKITDPAAAIAACDTAITTDGSQPRFLYQRARAYARAADIVSKAKDDTLVAQHRAAEAADLQRAMELGYPMAFHNEANRYDNGQGVEKDKAKAAALYLEFFNRVMACCWAPVARQLLAAEAEHDRAT